MHSQTIWQQLRKFFKVIAINQFMVEISTSDKKNLFKDVIKKPLNHCLVIKTLQNILNYNERTSYSNYQGFMYESWIMMIISAPSFRINQTWVELSWVSRDHHDFLSVISPLCAASISLLSSCYFEYVHTSSDDRKTLMKLKSETSSDWWSVR